MTSARRPQAGDVRPWAFGGLSPGQQTAIESGLVPRSQVIDPRSQPGKPGVIFKRSDHPFHGRGTQVSLHAVRGLTARRHLGVPFRFQIPPMDSWGRTFTGRMTAFDVIGGASGPRERSRPQGPGLRTVNFKTLFMDWHPSWGVWEPDVLAPIMAIRELEDLARKNVVFRLRIRNPHLYAHDDVSMFATITQGDVEEVAGEPDTRYITLSFTEYDELELERQARHDHGAHGPWSHKVVAGDTLHSLARHYYHQQVLWPVIANANPGMSNWAPSRPLTEWAKKQHRTRVRVPEKPKATKGKGIGVNVGGNRSQGVGRA